MSKQDLPPDLVERSLASTVLFASSVVPLLKQAILTVKEDIERLPPGGMRHYKSELQPRLIFDPMPKEVERE